MVWHTFMLNPRDYLSDCIRHRKRALWNNGFPWGIVNACIDNDTFDYETSKEAHEYFEKCTQKPYNALEMPSKINIKCPRCSRYVLSCSWTTCHQKSDWVGLTPGEHGEGFGEKDFVKMCPNTSCNFLMTHEQLRVNKFYGDILRLKSGILMPGTILDNNGRR